MRLKEFSTHRLGPVGAIDNAGGARRIELFLQNDVTLDGRSQEGNVSLRRDGHFREQL